MAIGVRISYIEDDHNFPRRVLLVDALGVSGGDQCHKLTKGEEIELWISSSLDSKVTLRDDGEEKD